MAIATLERPINLYPVINDAELSHPQQLPTHLRASAPQTWIWCFNCERVFQLGERRVACPYFDCGTSPVDFWQLDAYEALAGAAVEPVIGERYSLLLKAA